MSTMDHLRRDRVRADGSSGLLRNRTIYRAPENAVSVLLAFDSTSEAAPVAGEPNTVYLASSVPEAVRSKKEQRREKERLDAIAWAEQAVDEDYPGRIALTGQERVTRVGEYAAQHLHVHREYTWGERHTAKVVGLAAGASAAAASLGMNEYLNVHARANLASGNDPWAYLKPETPQSLVIAGAMLGFALWGAVAHKVTREAIARPQWETVSQRDGGRPEGWQEDVWRKQEKARSAEEHARELPMGSKRPRMPYADIDERTSR